MKLKMRIRFSSPAYQTKNQEETPDFQQLLSFFPVQPQQADFFLLFFFAICLSLTQAAAKGKDEIYLIAYAYNSNFFQKICQEPGEGLEPTTHSLQNCCSTTELSRPDQTSAVIPLWIFLPSPNNYLLL